MRLFRSLPVILSLSLWGAVSLAQPIQPSPPFSVLVTQWTRILDEAQRLTQTSDISAAQIETYRQLLGKVRTEAQTARQTATKQIEAIELLLNALGKPPDADQLPEPDGVAASRQRYTEDLADYRARVALADLTRTRAEAIERTLQKLGRGQLRAFYGNKTHRRWSRIFLCAVSRKCAPISAPLSTFQLTGFRGYRPLIGPLF